MSSELIFKHCKKHFSSVLENNEALAHNHVLGFSMHDLKVLGGMLHVPI